MMTAGVVYGLVVVLSVLVAIYFIARSMRTRSLAGRNGSVGENHPARERDYSMPAGGVQLGRRFHPETGNFNSVETDEGLNPNPITASSTLKETLEAKNNNPRR